MFESKWEVFKAMRPKSQQIIKPLHSDLQVFTNINDSENSEDLNAAVRFLLKSIEQERLSLTDNSIDFSKQNISKKRSSSGITPLSAIQDSKFLLNKLVKKMKKVM